MLPVAVVAIVKAWTAANADGAYCKGDERKQVLSEMKKVGALMHSLALAAPLLTVLTRHPLLAPNPRRCKERLAPTHLSTRRMMPRSR